MNSNALQIGRVRRRLFGDENTEETIPTTNDEPRLLDLCDVVESVESHDAENVSLDVTPNEYVEETFEEEKPTVICLQQLLIVTYDQNSESIKILDKCTRKETGDWIALKFCRPQDALQQTHQHAYKAIYTDIDLSPDSEMLRVICSIRKSSISNRQTPIIAMRQNNTRRGADNLFYYGVSYVCYVKLTDEIYEDLQKRLQEFDPDQTNVIDITPSNETVDLHDIADGKDLERKFSEQTTVTSSPLFIETPKTRTDVADIHPPCVSSPFNMIESNVTPFSTLHKSIYLASEKVTHADQRQAHIVRPFIQNPGLRHMQRPLDLLSRPKLYHPQCLPQHCKPGINNELKPPDMSYMISGEGSRNMTMTMLEDDLGKHSTKERMRRERIKYCCEQFRELLPKSRMNSNSKKIDMATLLELTVFYIKMLQKHSTLYCQQQCSQVFEFYFNQLSSGKRTSPETDEAYLANPPKMLRFDVPRSGGNAPRSKQTKQKSMFYESIPTFPSTSSSVSLGNVRSTIDYKKSQQERQQQTQQEHLVQLQQKHPLQHQQQQDQEEKVQQFQEQQHHQKQKQQQNQPQQQHQEPTTNNNLQSTILQSFPNGVQTSSKLAYFTAPTPAPPPPQQPATPLSLMRPTYHHRYIEPFSHHHHHHYIRSHQFHQPLDYGAAISPNVNVYDSGNLMVQPPAVIGAPPVHQQKDVLYHQSNVDYGSGQVLPHYLSTYKYQQ